ncbi:hypothetical protein ACFP2F_18560 [Hymenobacter artigasi]|uniref:Uncharacterized protein n=1 Tax=Hymenobacter artigasi TaxID=2719616 RepID=A0ABX1HL11_9BACT|nr:hypothetical protein [Hymenobacter artigasi]NKI90948.1 hypothetical protein [Hymenobacter artigasi]
MKFFVALLWALPFFAAGQVLPPAAPNPAPPVVAADSSAGWELRLDYEARTSYLGREYGSHAYSLNPQVSYSAANGLYGRLEGLYFSPVRPGYVYTSLELGYAGEFTDNWSYSLSGSRTFYAGRITKKDSVLRNNLEAYTQYALGPVALGLDYNFLFDHFQAHTLGLNLSVPLEKGHWLGFDKVSFTPAAELDWGSSLALLRFGTLATPLDQNFAKIDQPSLRLVPLAYEFSFPLEVQRGPLALNLAGHLLAPLRVRGETQAPPAFGYLSAALILRLPAK